MVFAPIKSLNLLNERKYWCTRLPMFGTEFMEFFLPQKSQPIYFGKATILIEWSQIERLLNRRNTFFKCEFSKEKKTICRVNNMSSKKRQSNSLKKSSENICCSFLGRISCWKCVHRDQHPLFISVVFVKWAKSSWFCGRLQNDAIEYCCKVVILCGFITNVLSLMKRRNCFFSLQMFFCRSKAIFVLAFSLYYRP